MLRSRRIQSGQPPIRSAATVRNRLLADRTMRHHEHSCWYVVHLSPAEQRHQALQIVRSFKHHYLAEINYHDDRHLTIALVKPADARRPAHEIWVDAAGNVSVHHRGTPWTPYRLLRPVCVALSIALVCLFVIIFI
jgi:hypothetical protein